eukprot:CAMPEP_0116028072 /NCGR_PEP_ID=MMETSP0321-20121206/15140_1 /TAXON_ID=163516 /ORGANISM="Leptocylindrus danicus var. danicus, Strain B650" /LENGTH=154 /DNA_ID=CAMNT_0003501815 /DNA_START=43 /DNA_END=507 /DNA_ORIENTATION=+
MTDVSVDDERSRSASVPPVMRMRSLRQKIIQDRFTKNFVNTSIPSSSSSSPMKDNGVASSSAAAAAALHVLPRDRVSLSVRDDAAQSKFEWEERQRKQKDAGVAVVVNVNSPARMSQVSADSSGLMNGNGYVAAKSSSFARRRNDGVLLNQVTP